MSNRPSRIAIPVYTPSYDGRYHGRYPDGNKPVSGAALEAGAAGQVAAAGALTTAIRLTGGAASVAASISGLSSGIRLAAAAADVVGASASLGINYDAQLLYTSQDMTFVDDPGGNTADWRTDEAQGYARITWNNPAGVVSLQHTLANRNSAQVYVSYYVRRHGNPGAKQLKVLGQGAGNAKNCCTFGPTANGYSDTECYLYYGDAVSGGNDNNVDLRMDGVMTGGGAFTRAQPTYTYRPARVFQNVSGSVWERYELYALFNTVGGKDGRFGIAKNGMRIFQIDNVYNCADDVGARLRDYIGIGEYTSNSGFFEDYKRVDISTSYVPNWMT